MKKILYISNLIRNTFDLKINGLIKWYKMKQEKRIEKSRDEWRGKAVSRATELREARKLKATHKEKIRLLSMEIKELHDRLKKKTLNSPH